MWNHSEALIDKHPVNSTKKRGVSGDLSCEHHGDHDDPSDFAVHYFHMKHIETPPEKNREDTTHLGL